VTTQAGLPALYPNPTADFMTLEHPALSGTTYAIYDMVGQLVMTGEATHTRVTLDIRLLRAGTYRLSTSGGVSASFSVVR
jgi:hypothetical protein